MAQTESLTEVVDKRAGKTLLAFMRLVDPECKYTFAPELVQAWNRLSLNEQRKLYLYLLYRKWRGLDIYGEPYYIIMNCHPVPYDWNGSQRCAELIAERKVQIAKHNGSYGWYTKDEIRLYGLEVKRIER